MRFLIVLICVIIVPFFSVKPENIDSLIRILPGISDPVEKSTLLNKICLSLVYNNPDSALYFGREALNIGRQENNTMIIGKAFNRIGIVYDVENDMGQVP